MFLSNNLVPTLAPVSMNNNYYPVFVLQVVEQEINNIPKLKIEIVEFCIFM